MTDTFEYVAQDRAGQQVKGRMEAKNAAAVARRLKGAGQTVVSVSAVSSTGMNREIKFGGKRVKPKDLVVATRQLATMVEAGISLVRSLDILVDQTPAPALRAALQESRQAVEQGRPLSEGLALTPRAFPPLMVNMVSAGETGGFLDRSLLSVARTLEADAKLRSKVVSAMTYPLVVFGIAILATTGMLLFVVPMFADMYEGMGAELPPLTQALIALSAALQVGAPVLLVGVFAVLSWYRKHKSDDRVRSIRDPLLLKMPVFGVLIQKIAVSRFCRNFAAMVAAGVPLLKALQVVGTTSGNLVVEQASTAIGESVRRGESLTAPLGAHPVFPPMVRQMMAIGEEAGSLELMLTKVHEFYDQEIEATTDALASLIEPFLIVGIGVLIGGLVLALYMPMFSMFEHMT